MMDLDQNLLQSFYLNIFTVLYKLKFDVCAYFKIVHFQPAIQGFPATLFTFFGGIPKRSQASQEA